MFFIFLDFTSYRFLPTKCVALYFLLKLLFHIYILIYSVYETISAIHPLNLTLLFNGLQRGKRLRLYLLIIIFVLFLPFSMLYFTQVGVLKLPKRASFTAPRLMYFHTDNFEISWIYTRILLHSSVPPVVHYHATATTRMPDTAVWLSAKRYKQLPLILFTHRRNRGLCLIRYWLLMCVCRYGSI